MTHPSNISRRRFAELSAGAAAAALPAAAQLIGHRPAPPPPGVAVLNPRARVPVSLIIDDSTCLVNLAHFCIPHFAEVYPENYKQDWRKLPREIPDTFVRKFANWCHDHGVKGKYSIVPNPACVGWMDRDLPGWSKRQLEDSLALVRSDIMPDWDIHPEMVTHTWVIDTKTGRPLPERTEKQMENFGWSAGRSVDELADYLSYALRILKNAGLTCEGITTPGGFGTRALPELSQAALESCRDVFHAEIPHYFRHLFRGAESVAPRVEYASGLQTEDPRCSVSIIGCTGDWFGSWDGLQTPSADQYITAAGGGRVPEIIKRGEPAVMVCHWPGIYCNGEETGFRAFQDVVTRLHATFDNLIWMKLSEISRYWAAKELTGIVREGSVISLQAPFACSAFTMAVPASPGAPRTKAASAETQLREVKSERQLAPGSFFRSREKTLVCFDLPKGTSTIHV